MSSTTGGETGKEPSGWTTDVLRAHLESKLDELDRRYEQRFVAQEKAVINALAAAKEAVSKAEFATERRFDSVNEFRAALSDQTSGFLSRSEFSARFESLLDHSASQDGRMATYEAGFLPRVEYAALHSALDKKVDDIVKALTDYRSQLANIQGRTAAYTVALGMFFTVISIALRFVKI